MQTTTTAARVKPASYPSVIARALDAKERTPLVSEILALHGEILSAARTSLDKAIRIGELLVGIKADLAHGEWLSWLKANIPFAERTARNYMRCHAERELLKSASVADLGEAYRLLAAPTAPEDSDIEEQYAADQARLRVLEQKLNDPSLSIEQCYAIVKETGAMQNYWARRKLMAERECGRILNEAEKLGIKDQVLAEVNRMFRAEAAA
jgi:hypothetical protein